MKQLILKWLSQKTTKTAIVLLVVAIAGVVRGDVQIADAIDKAYAVLIGFVTIYLASNIGEAENELG